MSKTITIVQGHPDPEAGHFCHALSAAYEKGANSAGHSVRHIEVAQLKFPLLQSQSDFEEGSPPESIAKAQDDFLWADHIVLIYPLWLGTMPAVLKGFLEQVIRPGFAMEYPETGWPIKKLNGRSARIVVTMGMPALVFRWFYGAHSLKSLERNILNFCGIKPVRETIIGFVEQGGPERHQKLLAKLEGLGRKGI